jgi:hypothetical protein
VPLAVVVLVQVISAYAQPRSEVQIAVQTPEGDSVNNRSVRFIAVSGNVDYSSRVKDGKVQLIPFGYYDLSVSAPGFRDYNRRIGLFENVVMVRVIMRVSAEFSGPLVVRGRITPREDLERTWVTLYPLSGSPQDILESRVASDGKFSLSTFGGAFLLIVTRGDQLLYCRHIYAGHDSAPIDVVLAYSERCRSAFRSDGDRDSERMPIAIPR